jgi:transcriptional regulator with XRE-family HTH domain
MEYQIPMQNKKFVFRIILYLQQKIRHTMNIGDKLRAHRKEKDMKAQEIYDKLGISQSTYSKMENNKYKIDIKTLKEIATELGVDVVKLIGEDKISINHTNADNSSGGSGIVVTNTHSEELITSLKDQITLLKEQNLNLKEEIQSLKQNLKL